MQRNEKLDVIKLLSMFLVIIGHAAIVFRGNGWGGVFVEKNQVLNLLVMYVGSFHTYAFIWISGYLHSLSFSRSRDVISSAFVKERIINRAKRLLLPYVCISIVWAGPVDYIVIGINLRTVLINYGLATSCAQLWFLIALFLLFTLFSLFYEYIIHVPASIGIMFFLILRIAGDWMSQYLPMSLFSMNSVLIYSLIYYLGFLSERNNLKIESTTTVFILFITQFILFKLYINVEKIKYVNTIVHSFLNIAGVYSFYGIICCVNIITEKIFSIRIFRFLMQIRMGLYLFHQQIIYILLRIMPINVNAYLYVLTLFLIATLLSSVISNFLMKIKMGKLVIG